MLDQCTAEEVEEHLAAASNINEEQEQARGEMASMFKTLKGVHITLHYQFLELTQNILSKDYFACMSSATAMTNRSRSRIKVMTAHQAMS